MTDEHHQGEGAQELGRSYGALLDQQLWNADMPDDAAVATDPADPSTAPPPLLRIVEAMLFVGGPPLTPERAAEVARGLTPAQFTQAVDALNREYQSQGRPYRIRHDVDGYTLVLRGPYEAVRERLYGGPREVRLSPPAVEVLSLVAYRQPATKQEVDSFRGAESGGLLRQLVRLGLLTVVQRGDAASKEVAYGTTPRFLDLFKLRSLDDLPQTQDLQRL